MDTSGVAEETVNLPSGNALETPPTAALAVSPPETLPISKPRKPGQFDGSKPGPGRPKGTENATTKEIRTFARNVIRDREYRKNLLVRIRQGRAPQIEALLYHYGYGKPKEAISFEGADGGPVVFTLQLGRTSEAR